MTVIQSIEMHIMAAFTVLFGTDSSFIQVRDLKGLYLFNRLKQLLEYISV